jgi:glycosyltransferase involved in cell wall biosynthesis
VRILVLTFYFAPDLSAGAFRATRLVESIRAVIPPESSVDVLTTLPNRYRSFAVAAPEREREGNVSIRRIALPPHQSGIVDQTRAFVSFARDVRREIATREYDIVVATSSRLMTAVLGTVAARRTGAVLYLDIRDILVDTIGDVMAKPAAWLVTPFLSLLERWAVSTAAKVNLVSRGFASHFEVRYPNRHFSYFTNGVDDEFVGLASPNGTAASPRPTRTTVLYAGNIGDGQGLHLILPELATRMRDRIDFRVIGDGGRRAALERALAARSVTNVSVLPPVSRRELSRCYDSADVLLLTLGDYEAFKRVLPSKIFEYAAVGKPVWGGVTGYAAEFLHAEVENSATFRPGDVAGAIRSFDTLQLRYTARSGFVEKYSRRRISHEMALDVLSVAATPA